MTLHLFIVEEIVEHFIVVDNELHSELHLGLDEGSSRVALFAFISKGGAVAVPVDDRGKVQEFDFDEQGLVWGQVVVDDSFLIFLSQVASLYLSAGYLANAMSFKHALNRGSNVTMVQQCLPVSVLAEHLVLCLVHFEMAVNFVHTVGLVE